MSDSEKQASDRVMNAIEKCSAILNQMTLIEHSTALQTLINLGNMRAELDKRAKDAEALAAKAEIDRVNKFGISGPNGSGVLAPGGPKLV